jgi:hypothetical protein
MAFSILFLLLFPLLSTPSFSQTMKLPSHRGGLARDLPVNESPLQVWRVGDRRWSVEEEIRYGKWVEKNITEDFFIRYNIPIDCADVPYAIRWIYARIAHLPAAATTKDHKLIGHWSTEWRHIPTHAKWHKDLRFRKALLHMLIETTTRTLPSDTYPIRIAQDTVTPGTPFFVTESHSGVVGQVILDGSCVHPLQTWEATVPAKVQKLNRRNFFTPRPESTIYSGLVKFRWPVFQKGRWGYLPAKDYPFYSTEQYASAFYEGHADYVEAVAKRIDPTDYDPWEKVDKVIETMTHYLQDRVPIVLEGFKQCHKGGCPEGSMLWEIYSTPGRDGMITLWMDHLHQIIESHHLDQEVIRKKMEAIPFDITRDRSISFYHLYENYLWLSPHPEDSIEARWGLKKCEMILSQIRSAENSIAFIEKTYRKEDPKYAEFAIRQQQEILSRLNTEWNRSRCKEPEEP